MVHSVQEWSISERLFVKSFPCTSVLMHTLCRTLPALAPITLESMDTPLIEPSMRYVIYIRADKICYNEPLNTCRTRIVSINGIHVHVYVMQIEYF